jgi:pimeloyl-ACP methyl ester carboxylesterase
MKTPRTVMPFYFGPADQPLFGCYHEPRIGHRRNCAIVICQPIGHEYIYCHRALRQLAARLCDSGFPVLRFDYYGCGDSSGNTEEGSIPQWLDDISEAISEIRRRANLAQVCLVGLRLGAALSMIIAAERGDIDSLVLWDPVLRGSAYLKGLSSLQKEALHCRPKPVGGRKSQSYMEIIGFPLSHALCVELERLSLPPIAEEPATNILAIQSHQPVGETDLKAHLSQTHARFEYQHVQAPQIWLPTVDGSLLVPSQILQSVVSWTCRMHA